MTEARTIGNIRRRLEEAHENLKAASTESRAAFYQTEVRKAQDVFTKNVKREKQALEKQNFFQKKGTYT